MKNPNIWIAAILAISFLAGVWIYTINTRFELSSAMPSGGVYKIDKKAGQVWFIAGPNEYEVKNEAKRKAEADEIKDWEEVPIPKEGR